MKYKVTLNGKTYEVEVELTEAMSAEEYHSYAPAAAPTAAPAPAVQETPTEVPAAAPAAPLAEGETISAPMPGTILKVNAVQGAAVKEGDVLVVLEAMKMENEILAPRAGTVKQVVVTKGTTVDTGTALVVLA